ncbi:glycosyltransferase family 4 protein [Sanguibacter suaedae]|uniref:Glycosyltransferase n=1 Tax=Sanguibacter suaedae TaxID=2795737 RepID=A0A934I5H3_9MICO|nr:glycosyltransferase family 4 protein [Sanguibacter suaedae]MBI9114616.1 glycosyltransferase [Sanguibacter suaedae]
MSGLASGRPGELLSNATLAWTTVLRHLVEDPLLLAVQVVRRAPRRVGAAAAGALLAGARGRQVSVRAATALWLLDRPDEARSRLRAVFARSADRAGGRRSPTGPVRARLAGELAVQLGVTDDAPAAVRASSPSVEVRARWQSGDVSGAVRAASAQPSTRALHARLVSEAAVMTVGHLIGETAGSGTAARTGGTSVVHVLTNSLPHTQSGYAQRSHSVLLAQRDAGLRPVATTRLGYPVSVGRLGARHTDVVDGITYRRLLAPVAGRTAEDRVRQGVDLLVPIARDHGADALHATTNYTNALVARAAAHRLGVPWVYEVRGLLEETWVASRPSRAERETAAASERYRMLRARETELTLAADHVLTLSSTLRAELVDRGVPEDRITLVPNAVDAALLDTHLSPAEARQVLGLPADGLWVGTVSSLVDYEGLDTLVAAVAHLRGRGLDVRGLIVGDGVSRPSLEAAAHHLGISSAVTFTGRVPRDSAALHHQALDVFVVPRRDHRVCRLVTPLKPVEAMACARPVVASDVPALAELVREPGSGHLVPPGDAVALADTIAGLAEDADLRRALGARGRTFAAGRTWRSVGATYRDVLHGAARGVVS